MAHSFIWTPYFICQLLSNCRNLRSTNPPLTIFLFFSGAFKRRGNITKPEKFLLNNWCCFQELKKMTNFIGNEWKMAKKIQFQLRFTYEKPKILKGFRSTCKILQRDFWISFRLLKIFKKTSLFKLASENHIFVQN